MDTYEVRLELMVEVEADSEEEALEASLYYQPGDGFGDGTVTDVEVLSATLLDN